MSVLLFPGQGSQSPKMGEWLYQNFDIAQKTFQEASDSIGLDFKKLCFDSSDAELALTENTQPAIICVSIATLRVLQNLTPIKIDCAAGHSVGEYAALASAGVIDFSSAIQAVRKRGQFMQSAVPVGEGSMMATLGLDETQAQWLCSWVEKESGFSPLSAANFNCPGQIVISGSSKCTDWLKNNFNPEIIPGSPKRSKLIPLNVSAPFHCQMMNPAKENMKSVLNSIEFKTPSFPILQNFNAQLVTDPVLLKSNLIEQISAPVLWTQSMELLKKSKISMGIECGHGQILKGLFKKMDSDFFKIFSTQSLIDLDLIKTIPPSESERGL